MPTKRSDPIPRAELVERIVDHLLEHPLSGVTFRNLAEALEVSTFTLVYHFGTRQQVLRDVVRAVYARADSYSVAVQPFPETIDEFVVRLEAIWQAAIQPRSVLLKRLEIEAAMMVSHDPDGDSLMQQHFAQWCEVLRQMLLGIGVPERFAAAEARVIVTTFFGFQFDLITNRDDAAADAAFLHFADSARQRLSEWGNGLSR